MTIARKVQSSVKAEVREIIIPRANPVVRASGVRSTLVQSSLATLKTLGHYERYLQLVSPVHRETILGSIAPSWLPIEVGVAHYQACESLQLSDAELLALGALVGDRMQGAFMETLTRAGRAMGVTPWLLLKRFDVLWGRLFQGGSLQLTKVGPKDLLIEISGASLPRFAYFRQGFCGVVRAGFKYVGAPMAHVRVAQWEASRDLFLMRAAWV